MLIPTLLNIRIMRTGMVELELLAKRKIRYTGRSFLLDKSLIRAGVRAQNTPIKLGTHGPVLKVSLVTHANSDLVPIRFRRHRIILVVSSIDSGLSSKISTAAVD
jgi:hypothetical protein